MITSYLAVLAAISFGIWRTYHDWQTQRTNLIRLKAALFFRKYTAIKTSIRGAA